MSDKPRIVAVIPPDPTYDELRAKVDDLTNAATTAKNLLSRKHPHSVADVDGDAWEAWAVLEAALSQT